MTMVVRNSPGSRRFTLGAGGCRSRKAHTPEGWSRDVSADIAGDIINRADDADETLT
jgi:hypothetical protein